MRILVVALLLAGCDSTPSLPDSCPRECTPDDMNCGTFPYEQLPTRCFDICYTGSCCHLENGKWETEIFDCARQMPVDAG